EALGALAQGIFILGPALFLMAEAVRRFFDPQPVEHAAAVLGVMGLSIAMTAGLLAYQRRVIAATGSVAIRADSLHYAGDLWMNIAVIAAVALGSLTG